MFVKRCGGIFKLETRHSRKKLADRLVGGSGKSRAKSIEPEPEPKTSVEEKSEPGANVVQRGRASHRREPKPEPEVVCVQ